MKGKETRREKERKEEERKERQPVEGEMSGRAHRWLGS